MSERESFDAGKETHRGVLHDAGRAAGGSGDHMEALLRYLKGAGHGEATNLGRAKPLSDADIRTLAVRLVADDGGQVGTAIVAAGSVLLRGRIGCRSQIAPLERRLSQIPGVSRVDLKLAYDTDDL